MQTVQRSLTSVGWPEAKKRASLQMGRQFARPFLDHTPIGKVPSPAHAAMSYKGKERAAYESEEGEEEGSLYEEEGEEADELDASDRPATPKPPVEKRPTRQGELLLPPTYNLSLPVG